MFEAAELGRKISREDFDAMAPELRTELLDLQQQLRLAQQCPGQEHALLLTT